MAAALSFMSTVVNNAPLSSLISTLDASAMLFMNSTDASPLFSTNLSAGRCAKVEGTQG
jgi:hypothetical protein